MIKRLLRSTIKITHTIRSENEFVTRLTDEEKGINDKRIRDMENPGKKHNEDIVMDDMERITPRTQPTQEEIIEYNRKENQKKEQENTTVLVEKRFPGRNLRTSNTGKNGRINNGI